MTEDEEKTEPEVECPTLGMLLKNMPKEFKLKKVKNYMIIAVTDDGKIAMQRNGLNEQESWELMEFILTKAEITKYSIN